MKYSLAVFAFFFITKTTLAQQVNENNNDTLVNSDSLHFQSILDSVKVVGFVDSNNFEELRLAAILYMHKLDNEQAVHFLDFAYQFTPNDTIVNTLLYESLIMKIHKQKNPSKNIDDIMYFRKKYNYLCDSVTLNEIMFRDALSLLSGSFEKLDLKTINNYYDIAIKEIASTKNKNKLITIPNTEIMFFNVALKNYLAKEIPKTKSILKNGLQYYPENKDMKALQQHMNKTLK